MKIGVFSDIHFTDKAIKSRYDADIFSTQMGKFAFAIEKMKEAGVEVILQAGDLFDKPRQSNRVLTSLIEFFDAEIKEAGIKFYMTLGQHDVQNHNIADYTIESDIAILEAYGLVKVLHAGEKVIEDKVVIRGYGFGEYETKEFLAGTDDVEFDKDKINIAIVHASICDSTGPHDAWQDIRDQNIKTANIAIFGDIHKGFNPYMFPNALKTVAFSCGSLTRMKMDEADNQPKIAIIDTDLRKVEFINIYALSSEICFRPKIEKPIIDKSLGFIQRLEQAKITKKETPEEKMRRIGITYEYETQVIDNAIRYYGELK